MKGSSFNLQDLIYSRAEVAADARHRACSRGPSLRMPCNEADAVRSARQKSKKMAINIENTNKKGVKDVVSEKTDVSQNRN